MADIKLKLGDIYGRAAVLGVAMNEPIAKKLMTKLARKKKLTWECVDKAIAAYKVDCDWCGEEFGLDSVRCRDGEIKCDNCGG